MRSSGPPSKAAGAAPGLAGDQLACSPIPRAEPLLVVHIEPAGGDVTQVGRRRAEPADVADLRNELGEALALVAPPIDEIRKAGGDQGVLEFGRRAAVNRHAVQQCAPAADRCEQFAGAGHVDRADQGPIIDQCRDRHGIAGQVVQEVGGAVDRIDQPANAGGAGGIGAFLADQGIVGSLGTQAFDDHPLGGAIELGDDVGVRRLRRRRRDAVLASLDDELACCHSKPGGELTQLSREIGHDADLFFSRRSTSFHSPRARSTSTATTLMPRRQ